MKQRHCVRAACDTTQGFQAGQCNGVFVGSLDTVVPGVLYSVLPIQTIEASTQVNSVGRSVTKKKMDASVHQSHRNSGNIQQ